MTNASKQSYYKPENWVARISHKQKCFDALIGEKEGLTYPEIRYKTLLKETECQKRLSDLYAEEKVIIVGTREINGNTYSVYKINNQPPLVYCKKLTFKQFVRQENPELYQKWEMLNKREL